MEDVVCKGCLMSWGLCTFFDIVRFVSVAEDVRKCDKKREDIYKVKLSCGKEVVCRKRMDGSELKKCECLCICVRECVYFCMHK